MTEDFKKAVEIADQLENEINLLGVASDYIGVCTMAQFTAMAIRKQIPMYTGNLNPKWKIYDDVVAIIKGRINGQNVA